MASHDVERFRERWAALPVSRKPKGLEVVSLYDAMRTNSYGFFTKWKSDIVRKLLAGEVKVYSLQTQPFLDATVAVEDLWNVKAESEQQRLTLGGAGHALALSKLGVLRLVVDGHLSAVLTETQIAFERAEIRRFSDRYVRLRKVLGTSVRAGSAADACERRKIPVVRTGGRGCPVLYVERSRASRIRRLVDHRFRCSSLPGP